MSHAPKYEQQGGATAYHPVGHRGTVEKRRIFSYKRKEISHATTGKPDQLTVLRTGNTTTTVSGKHFNETIHSV